MKKGETRPNDLIELSNYVVIVIVDNKGRRYDCLVDKEDYDKKEVHGHRWSISHPKYQYVVRGQWDSVKKKYTTIRLNRLLCGRVVLKGEVVDHINGNCLDNRKSNLRITTQQNNTRNRTRIKNKTGVLGGCFSSSGRIKVKIRPDKGKVVHVGTYDNKKEAIKARIAAEKKYWGMSFTEEKL